MAQDEDVGAEVLRLDLELIQIGGIQLELMSANLDLAVDGSVLRPRRG